VKTKILNSAEREAIGAFLDLVAKTSARAHMRSRQAILGKRARAIDPAKRRPKERTSAGAK
jgi:hypothetical protein